MSGLRACTLVRSRVTHTLAFRRERLQALEVGGYIDHRTRAVIVDIAVYNPLVDLFGVFAVIGEVRNTGGLLPSLK